MKFTKMHGIGNDFVVVSGLDQNLPFLPIRVLSDRHCGIGFDQLLLIEPSTTADFFCRIFNADGSEAEQCGNGLRCVARFLHEENYHAATTMRLETKTGIFPVHIQNYESIALTIGVPDIKQSLIPFIKNDATQVMATAVNLGNPHLVVKVNDLEEANANFFPNDVNLGLMKIANEHHIYLRTFERGAGETYACGSNAVAAAASGILNGWLTSPVTVEFRQGALQVVWLDRKTPAILIGPATRVFSGIYAINSSFTKNL